MSFSGVHYVPVIDITNVPAPLHHQVGRVVIRRLLVGDPQLRGAAAAPRPRRRGAAGQPPQQGAARPRLPQELPARPVRADARVLEHHRVSAAQLQRNPPFLTAEESRLFSGLAPGPGSLAAFSLALYKHSAR